MRRILYRSVFLRSVQCLSLIHIYGQVFTQVENNLPEAYFYEPTPAGSRLYLSVLDYNTGWQYYTSGDGVWWDLVEGDFSPFLTTTPQVSYQGGLYIIQSPEATLLSEDGVHFTRPDLPGVSLTYYDGLYHLSLIHI